MTVAEFRAEGAVSILEAANYTKPLPRLALDGSKQSTGSAYPVWYNHSPAELRDLAEHHAKVSKKPFRYSLVGDLEEGWQVIKPGESAIVLNGKCLAIFGGFRWEH